MTIAVDLGRKATKKNKQTKTISSTSRCLDLLDGSTGRLKDGNAFVKPSFLPRAA